MSREKYPASSNEEVMGSLARALHEKGGDEVIPFIASLFGKLGSTAGAKLKRKMEQGDFKSAVTTFFSSALNAQPPRAEFLELTDEKLVIKAFICRIGLFGAGRKLCEAIMELDREMISQIAGEKIDMHIEKSMAAGDDCCLIKFQLQPEEDK